MAAEPGAGHGDHARVHPTASSVRRHRAGCTRALHDASPSPAPLASPSGEGSPVWGVGTDGADVTGTTPHRCPAGAWIGPSPPRDR